MSAEDGADVSQVEEAIRRAEELMSRDMVMLHLNHNFVEKEDSLERTGSDVDQDGRQSQSLHSRKEDRPGSNANRYQDPQAREDLIQRLLQQRESDLAAKGEVERLASAVQANEAMEERGGLAAAVSGYTTSQEYAADTGQNNALRTSEAKVSQPSGVHRRHSAAAATTSRETAKIAATTPRRMSLQTRRNSVASGRKAFSRKSLDQVKRQVEMEHAKDCTFQPKINRFRSSKKEDKDSRLERLAQSKREYWAKIEAKRREQEEKDLSKECTFKPDISAAKAIIEDKIQASSDPNAAAWLHRVQDAYRNHIPVEKRLHEDAGQRWEARERARRELEEAELQAKPYHPKVNIVSEAITRQIDYEPIEQRASRVQREKQERLAKKKLEYELGDKDLTFKPQISKASQRIAMNAALKRGEVPNQDVVQRLLHNRNSLHEKERHRQQAWTEQQSKECNFKPKVSANSNKLIAGNKAYGESIDFVTRQELLEQRRRERERRLRAETHNMAGVATFKPDVRSQSDPDRILVQSRPERLTETEEQRVQRLAHKDTARRMKLQSSIREHYYSQYDFRPKINPVSEEIVKETHASGPAFYEDLYRNERGKHYRTVAQSQVEEEVLKDCTFRPRTLNRGHAQASEVIRSSRRGSEETTKAIERHRRAKEHRLSQQRREVEFEELKECTFTPQVNESTPRESGGPVVVRGLGRFLELQNLAKRQAEEKREREAKVFLEDTSALAAEPYTIPQPFNLSCNTRRPRSSSSASQRNNYSFKPRTKVGANRKQVARLLDSGPRSRQRHSFGGTGSVVGY